MQAFGHKRMIADIFHFHLLTGFSCQDHDLAHYICSTQIKSWIRFGITFILRLFHHHANCVAIIIIENKIKCAA